MTDSTLIRRRKGRGALLQAGILAALVVILYSLLYVAQPFSSFYNDLAANAVTVVVAIASMVLASLTVRRYDPTEPPRKIWYQLAIGLGLWTVAEVIWAVYNMIFDEVGLTIADLLWVLGYAFFLSALLIQHRLLFGAERGRTFRLLSLWVGSILALTAVTAWLLITFTDAEWGWPLLVAAFYPAGDLVVGLAALWIVYSFRGGALGYPWMGLFVFAFADLLYALLEFSGAYSWSITNGNLLSTVADVSYVAAYLFVVLGCYTQLLLLRHGPFLFYERPREAR